MDVFQEAEMLRRVPFFGGLDSAKLKLLAFTSRALKFAPGEDLVKKGGASDSAYVILDGEAEVIGETSGGEFVIAALGSNALIGEMGVIRNVPRGADGEGEDSRAGAAHRLRGLSGADHRESRVRARRDAPVERARRRVERAACCGAARARIAAQTGAECRIRAGTRC